MNMKINPESAMLGQMDGHWQKVAMLLLWKLTKGKAVKITAADIEQCSASFAPGVPVILTHGHHDSIEFSIVDQAAADRLAAHEATMRGSA